MLPDKLNASVKIMRSFDYCHFEVTLSADEDEKLTLEQVNELRKKAQRLVDEAVRQFQVARSMAEKKLEVEHEYQYLEQQVKRILEKPESDRTAEEKAKVKALGDNEYWNRFSYSYEDDELEF